MIVRGRVASKVGEDANPPVLIWRAGVFASLFSASAFVSVMALVMVGSLSSVVFSQGAFINRGKNGP